MAKECVHGNLAMIALDNGLRFSWCHHCGMFVVNSPEMADVFRKVMKLDGINPEDAIATPPKTGALKGMFLLKPSGPRTKAGIILPSS